MNIFFFFFFLGGGGGGYEEYLFGVLEILDIFLGER